MLEVSTITWSDIVKGANAYKASDILLAQNNLYFKRGSESLSLQHTLSPALFEALCNQIHKENYLVDKDFTYEGKAGASDFSWETAGQRFRVNKYKTLQGTSYALRPLSSSIPSIEMVDLSREVVQVLDKKRQGLVIITGPTGSGKSTTLAAMIQYLNAQYPLNIITIEDPIEYVYTSSKSIIQQREIGSHVAEFSTAVRSAMRESPDVILVGEIRDYATLKACLQAAETGHLVFTTLHTKGVASTLMRMLDMAPGSDRREIASMLAMAYQMVMFQKLIFTQGKYVTIREILLPHIGVRNCLRQGSISEVNNTIQMSGAQGMVSWEGDIQRKLQKNIITNDMAKLLKESM